MAEHEKRIREALEAGPTEGDWEAWTGGKSRYGVTGPSAAACHSAQQGVSDCQVTADLPCVQIASSGSKAPALAFGDNELEAKANARLIAACNPAAIRALLADLDAVRGALERISCAAKATVSNPEWIAAHADAALKGASHD